MKNRNGFAIAIYCFILVCITIFLISAGNVTALDGLIR